MRYIMKICLHIKISKLLGKNAKFEILGRNCPFYKILTKIIKLSWNFTIKSFGPKLKEWKNNSENRLFQPKF